VAQPSPQQTPVQQKPPKAPDAAAAEATKAQEQGKKANVWTYLLVVGRQWSNLG
jgi:hypothetical protein